MSLHGFHPDKLLMNTGHQGIGMTSQRARNRLVEQLRTMGIKSERVLEAIRSTPRHIFVDEALSSRAYDNTALPIGYNQTISQPYIVARMTEALLDSRHPLENVLEIGTGCGYQTVILSKFAKQVSTIERIDALLSKARERFYALKCRNIRARNGDGTQGWAEHAPYDGIIVTAAPIGVPPMLLEQLADHGRLIIPVGKSGEQSLLLITRTENGYAEKKLDVVSFVPMLEGIS
jgi:protein-L-isoaspartate(D-aspartate) O-methyltransferase